MYNKHMAIIVYSTRVGGFWRTRTSNEFGLVALENSDHIPGEFGPIALENSA